MMQEHEKWKEQKRQEEIALWGPDGKPKEDDKDMELPAFRKNASSKSKVLTTSIMNKDASKDV